VVELSARPREKRDEDSFVIPKFYLSPTGWYYCPMVEQTPYLNESGIVRA